MIVSLLFLAATVPDLPVNPGMSRLAAGLAVHTDPVPEPMAVDGVAMTIHRVTGAGVPELARRIEADWRRQGSPVHTHQQGGWTLRSRIHGHSSEVLQWRTSLEGPELLLSSLDARSVARPTPDANIQLPPGCKWGRSISGKSQQHSYIQRSARCPLSVKALRPDLLASLSREGWRIRSRSATGLLVERGGEEGLLVLSTQSGDASTWLVWLHTQISP
jgi:hypothetical protein